MDLYTEFYRVCFINYNKHSKYQTQHMMKFVSTTIEETKDRAYRPSDGRCSDRRIDMSRVRDWTGGLIW
jgi:hypothetical protein